MCFNYKNFDPKDLCKKLYQNNKIMIGYGSFKGNEFIRLVTVNFSNKKEDILQMFKILEDFAEKKSHRIQKI